MVHLTTNFIKEQTKNLQNYVKKSLLLSLLNGIIFFLSCFNFKKILSRSDSILVTYQNSKKYIEILFRKVRQKQDRKEKECAEGGSRTRTGDEPTGF